MRRILHITTDNKFFPFALQTFESVYPGQNTVWLYAKRYNGQVSKNQCDENFSLIDIIKPSFLNKLANYELVVIHGMHLFKLPIIALAPKEVKFAWLGWGFDYYRYIYINEDDLLLNKSLELKNCCYKKSLKDYLNPIDAFKKIVKILIINFFQKKALLRINSVSMVLPNEYGLLEKSKLISKWPNYVPWSYGSLEESLVKNFINHRVHGTAVLVGNSASYTNNHIEVFDLLKNIPESKSKKIIAPLSYGDNCYLKAVISKGNEAFGNNFCPLENFLKIDEYVAMLKECGFVIMNHIRQQAVGNVIIMLYLGARVFLREENPVYKFFKNEGVVLNSIGELTTQPELLKRPMTDIDVENNIRILFKHWSKDAIDLKTKKLVEFHLGINL
jgi:dTDP-N-acetylfucosamine:lipid II N-acetylfucosaminyltransferase